MGNGGDKRRAPRVRRRVRVVFDHDPNLKAQTTNLSRSGLCVSSDYLAAPGAELGGTLVLPGGRANFEAVVIWARKVRSGQTLEEKNTMGLCFTIPPGTEYDRFVDDSVAGLVSGTHPIVMPRHELPDRGAAPLTEPVPVVAPLRRAGAVAQWLASPMGLIGRSSTTVDGKELAAPAGRYSCGLALGSVAGWVEQAAMRCLAGILPPNAVTVGVTLQITVAHDPAVLVGDQLATTVRVSEVSADGQTLTFELRVDDGRRALAAGRHTRQLLLQRKL